MKVVKAIATTLLSLLLFLCLTLTGVAITLNATALNPAFVTDQIDRLDVVTLFNDEAMPELQESEELAAHPEVVASFQVAVENNAPAVKAAINQAISETYDYLLHGGDIDLRQTLRDSLLDPQLAASIINDIDLSTFIHDILLEQLPLESVDIAGVSVDLTPYTEAVVDAVQPQLKQQIIALVPGLYDYLLGERTELNLELAVSPMLNDIKTTLKSSILAAPPAALAGLTQAQLGLACDAAWAEMLPQIPASITITTADDLGDEGPAEIGQALDDARAGLDEAHEVVGYYQMGFWGLIGLSLVLVLLIVLINHDVKLNCRILGSVFTTYGVIEAAGLLVSRYIVHRELPSLSDVPASLQPWLVQFVDKMTNPLLIFSLCCAALGILLYVISFLYHRRPQPTPAA